MFLPKWKFSAQCSSRKKNFVSTSKNLIRNRNWTFSVMHYFTWKPEHVSVIYWMIVSGNSFLLLVQPRCLLCLGKPPKRFLFLFFLYLHFIFFPFLIFILLLLFFVCWCSSFTFAFRHHPLPFHGLSPGFYTHFILSVQPITEWFSTLSFSIFPGSSYCECYGFEWAFFTHRRLLP